MPIAKRPSDQYIGLAGGMLVRHQLWVATVVAAWLILVLPAWLHAQQDQWNLRGAEAAGHSILQQDAAKIANRDQDAESTDNQPRSNPQTFTARPTQVMEAPSPVADPQPPVQLIPEAPTAKEFADFETNTLRTQPLDGVETETPSVDIESDDRGTFAARTQQNDFGLPPMPQDFGNSESVRSTALPVNPKSTSSMPIVSRSADGFGQPAGFGAQQDPVVVRPVDSGRIDPSKGRLDSNGRSPGINRLPAPPQGSAAAPSDLRTMSVIDRGDVQANPVVQANPGNSIAPIANEARPPGQVDLRDDRIQPSTFNQEGNGFNDLAPGGGFARAQPAVRPLPSGAQDTYGSGSSLKETLRRTGSMLQRFTVQGRSDIQGRPIPLQEMLLEPLPAGQRTQMIAQYWETYYDWAALNIAAEHQEWLQSISGAGQGADAAILQTAKRIAADRVLAARIQLGNSQSRLLDYMPTPRDDSFQPLPSDTPLTSGYNADYETYRRRGMVPRRLRGIDQMIKATSQLIGQRTETVELAKATATQLVSGVSQRQATLSSALQATELCRRAELDLLASVVNYNQAIGDYVLSVEPARSPAQLVAFMIGSRDQSASKVADQAPAFRQATLPAGQPLPPTAGFRNWR